MIRLALGPGHVYQELWNDKVTTFHLIRTDQAETKQNKKKITGKGTISKSFKLLPHEISWITPKNRFSCSPAETAASTNSLSGSFIRGTSDELYKK